MPSEDGMNAARSFLTQPRSGPCALCRRFRRCQLRRFVELCRSCGRYSHYTAQDLGLKGIQIMKRMLFALLAATALGASSGCCCLENWWCRPWGCCGGCNDGCGGGCGDSCGGGCSSCGGQYGQQGNGGPQGYAQNSRNCGPRGCGQNGCGHGNNQYQYGPDQYADDSGPPSGQVTYPYYTNRGPRDFLARNPRTIGP